MIIDRFKIAVKELGYTREFVIKNLEITKYDYGNITSNKKKITPELSLLIEKKLGINAVWLIFGRGNMKEVKDNFDAKKYLEDQNTLLQNMQKQNEELAKKLG